jgi:hypothetical protein
MNGRLTPWVRWRKDALTWSKWHFIFTPDYPCGTKLACMPVSHRVPDDAEYEGEAPAAKDACTRCIRRLELLRTGR